MMRARIRNNALGAVMLMLATGSASWADQPKESASPPVVITDIASWQHPVKKVLEKYKLTLLKVELLKDRKYPVFHVASWPWDPRNSHNDSYFAPLMADLFAANGKWPYTIQCDEENIGFDVKWDPKHKTLDWTSVELN